MKYVQNRSSEDNIEQLYWLNKYEEDDSEDIGGN